MKKSTFLVLAILLTVRGFSISDRIKLGLSVSPGISWLKPMGNEINKGVVGYGMQYGIRFEYYFKDQNYAISTGLFGGMDGGGVQGRSVFTTMTGGRSVVEKYTTNYMMLPAYLKLKTNPIKGKFIFFGEVGFQMTFNVSARASYDNTLMSGLSITKENVFRSGNDVEKVIPGFRYHVFDFRLSAGGGMEYVINDKTSVFFAIHYNNGFVTVMNDRSVNPKNDAIVARNVLFSFGAMF